MAHKGNNVDLTKTAKKLLSQLAFAAVIIGLAAIVTYNKFPQLSLELIDFNGFNNLSWFVGYYFVIIVLGKLFLNNLLGRMDKKNYIMFLAVIFAMVSLYYSRYILVNFVTGLEVILQEYSCIHWGDLSEDIIHLKNKGMGASGCNYFNKSACVRKLLY